MTLPRFMNLRKRTKVSLAIGIFLVSAFAAIAYVIHTSESETATSLPVPSAPMAAAGKFRDIYTPTLIRDARIDRSELLSISQKAFAPEQSKRLWDLESGRIVRINLTHKGVFIAPPDNPIIALHNGQHAHLLVLLRNGLDQKHLFEVSVPQGPTEAYKDRFDLAPGSVMPVLLSLNTATLGDLLGDIEVVAGGHSAQGKISTNIVAGGNFELNITHNGKTVPARVYLSGADGLNREPAGVQRYIMPLSGEHFHYHPGSATYRLPEGVAKFEILRGPNFWPVTGNVEVKQGETVRVDISLETLAGTSTEDWMAADTHVHGNYSGEQTTTDEIASIAAAAEGLDVLPLLVSNSNLTANVHDIERFRAGHYRLTPDEPIITWGQEIRNNGMLGHIVVINSSKLLQPYYTGTKGTPHPNDEPSMYDYSTRARKSGGLVIYAHPAMSLTGFPSGYALANEAVIDVPLGKVDVWEVHTPNAEPSMELWYRFLNLGFELPPTGGSDAMLNHTMPYVLGGNRVYTYVGNDRSYDAWVEGLRRGNSFVTAGPMLFFEVDGQKPGSKLKSVSKEKRTVQVSARAVSWLPMKKLEIIVNKKVVETIYADHADGSNITWSGTVELDGSAWIAARVWGDVHPRIPNNPVSSVERRSDDLLLAHTAPVFAYVNHKPPFNPKERDYMIGWLNNFEAQTKANKNISADGRAELLHLVTKARTIYENLQ